MARKPKSGDVSAAELRKRKSEFEQSWGGFINIRLTDEEKEDFETWLEDNQVTMWEDMVTMLASKIKMSVSYDADGDFYTVSLMNGYGAEVGLTLRYCLTARAETWERCIGLSLYKHFILAEGNWGNYKPNTSTVERFS